jgi:hypothetical protein
MSPSVLVRCYVPRGPQAGGLIVAPGGLSAGKEARVATTPSRTMSPVERQEILDAVEAAAPRQPSIDDCLKNARHALDHGDSSTARIWAVRARLAQLTRSPEGEPDDSRPAFELIRGGKAD